MASWLMRMSPSSGKSTTNCWLICSGLQAVAQRRSARCGLFSPFHLVGGLSTTLPSGRCSCPLSRSVTYSRNRELLASFAGSGRRAAVCAFHCATVARHSGLRPRVAALRRNSREIVPGSRLSSRAIARTPRTCAVASPDVVEFGLAGLGVVITTWAAIVRRSVRPAEGFSRRDTTYDGLGPCCPTGSPGHAQGRRRRRTDPGRGRDDVPIPDRHRAHGDDRRSALGTQRHPYQPAQRLPPADAVDERRRSAAEDP